MAFPAVMKVAAMKRASAVMCFMTVLLFELSYSGPSAAPEYFLFRSLFLRPDILHARGQTGPGHRQPDRTRTFAERYSRSIDSQFSNPQHCALAAVSKQIPAGNRLVPHRENLRLSAASATL